MLYLGLGDGGGAGDEGRGHAPGGNGQSLGTLLGKILRLDPRAAGSGPYAVPADNPFVGVEGARPEIWVYGLRNPWRFSFDRATGDLWIGDVGQNRWEEIDLIPAGAAAGANLGWNLLEGTHEFRGAPPPGAVPPVFEYPHSEGCSVTGGYVYRGPRIPQLAGAYLFTDYCDGTIRALRVEDGVLVEADLGVATRGPTSFGEDRTGELYVLSAEGVLRIDPG
ncbi:MAG: PQQ-dependent sugar dehydrogenase [Acidimicrobiia bacterium]|nr:PQQ-dependent sugar dehydrogenase [Acidimicrobiia bacterium]